MTGPASSGSEQTKRGRQLQPFPLTPELLPQALCWTSSCQRLKNFSKHGKCNWSIRRGRFTQKYWRSSQELLKGPCFAREQASKGPAQRLADSRSASFETSRYGLWRTSTIIQNDEQSSCCGLGFRVRV